MVGSSIAREADCGVYIHAGPEIGVASTKAFTSQVITLNLINLFLSQTKGVNRLKINKLITEMSSIPDKIEAILSLSDEIREIAKYYKDANNFLYLGRGFQFPVALEGALKLKEISYIHAEAYPAGELKHGPLALIDEEMPVIALAPESEIAEKLVSNLEEVKARGGTLYVFSDPSISMDLKSGRLIKMPKCDFLLTPIIYTIPLQILSYEVALLRGTDIDQPRNLAKSVTVE